MVWYAQEVLHLSSLCKELPHSITMLPYKVGQVLSHTTTRKMREWGIDIGFTYMPKFTYWESLTPEPLLKTRGEELNPIRSLVLSGSRTTYLSCGGSYRLIPRCLNNQNQIHDTWNIRNVILRDRQSLLPSDLIIVCCGWQVNHPCVS